MRNRFTFPVGDLMLAIFRGIGQIIFQAHAGTGALFLIGVAVGGLTEIAAVWMAAAGLVGSLIGTSIGRVVSSSSSNWLHGLDGFNPALVGMAAMFFFRPSAAVFGLAVAFAIVATGIAILLRPVMPIYTMPFVVSAWAMHFVGQHLGLEPVVWPTVVTQGLQLPQAMVEGVSEVMLIGGNIYTGAIFILALAWSNWHHAVLAVIGAGIGAAIAAYDGETATNVDLGLYGYNAALAAIAAFLWRPSFFPAAVGAVLAVLVTEWFPRIGLPTLTAPFVLAAWAVRAIGWVEPKFSGS